MNRWLLTISAKVYAWALERDLTRPDLEKPLPKGEVRRLAWREITAIRESILAHFDYQDREQRILSDRLARRFDLGMALNEAANRAIGEKKATMNPAGLNYPTPQQQAALDLQARTLQERVKNA
jgi:hypothetical protein